MATVPNLWVTKYAYDPYDMGCYLQQLSLRLEKIKIATGSVN